MNNSKAPEEITEQLLKHMRTIEIPDELDQVVEEAIKMGTAPKERILTMKKSTMKTRLRNTAATAAVVAVGFVGAANLSPTFAQSLSDIPVLGTLVNVVSFRQFDYHEDTYSATIDTPIIEGLGDETLQATLNEKYIEENKKLFEQFESDVAKMETFDEPGHLGVDSGFEIKTNNEQILSIAHYVVNTIGSSSTTMTYNNIDKQNKVIITLPSLFIDDSYVKVISENIKDQMREKRLKDSDLVYWIAGEPDAIDGFDSIAPDQDFYISDEGKLVISFDKYLVGPGSMGIQEFEIPTEILQDILVSNTYIK